MARIGLFGGTFNPVHMGHLRVAQEVCEGFALDKVIFIPAAIPPHKDPAIVAPPADRCEMLNRATADNPWFEVSLVELEREGPSYTIDTARFFFESRPGAEFFLIMGIDAFLELHTWKDYRDLSQMMPIIVMDRPVPGKTTRETRGILGSYIARFLDKGYTYSNEQYGFVHPSRPAVSVFHVTLLDISATGIRSRIKEQRSIRYLVPDPVNAYIEEKQLYR